MLLFPYGRLYQIKNNMAIPNKSGIRIPGRNSTSSQSYPRPYRQAYFLMTKMMSTEKKTVDMSAGTKLKQ